MEFQEILDSRRSIRSYDAAKKVTKEQVEELIEAALQAPSWKNSETARYHCVLNEDVIAKIREEALPAFNQKSSAGAALIVATFVKDVSGYTKVFNDDLYWRAEPVKFCHGFPTLEQIQTAVQKQLDYLHDVPESKSKVLNIDWDPNVPDFDS